MHETVGSDEDARNIRIYNKEEMLPTGADDPKLSLKFSIMADAHSDAIREGRFDCNEIVSIIHEIEDESVLRVNNTDGHEHKAFRDYVMIRHNGRTFYITSCFMEPGGEKGFYIYNAKKNDDGVLAHEIIEFKELSGPYMTAIEKWGGMRDLYRNFMHGTNDTYSLARFVDRDHVKKALQISK